jgi:hypothetical protein
VDLTAPSVAIDSRLDGTDRADTKLRLEFSADESGVSFLCSLDGATPEPCSPGWSMGPLSAGVHEVHVEGVDLAGNASSPADPAASRRFTVLPAPVWVPQAPAAPPAAAAAAPGTTPAAQPAAVGVRSRSARATRTVRPSAPRPRVIGTSVLRLTRGARPTVHVNFDVPRDVRVARISVRDFEGGSRTRIAAHVDVEVAAGEPARVMWTLTAAQARRLRAGRYRLTVGLGAHREPAWTGTLRVRPAA